MDTVRKWEADRADIKRLHQQVHGLLERTRWLLTMTMRDDPIVYLELDPEANARDLHNLPCPLCDMGSLVLIKHDDVCKDFVCYGAHPDICGRRMCWQRP